MKTYTQQEIDTALKEVQEMEHYNMCYLWRMGSVEDNIYFRSDYPVAEVFKDRLFNHFGGFTPEISKRIGWEKTK